MKEPRYCVMYLIAMSGEGVCGNIARIEVRSQRVDLASVCEECNLGAEFLLSIFAYYYILEQAIYNH